MKAKQLLTRIRRARAAWEAAVAGLDGVRLVQPGYAGEWSARDVIAGNTSEHYRDHVPSQPGGPDRGK